MTTPNLNQLIFYDTNPLDDADYESNWATLVQWLTDGDYDFTINSLTADIVDANFIGNSDTVYYGRLSTISGVGVIANGTFETDTSGWVTYDNGAVAVPTTGTGGVADITFSRTTTAPLFGVGSGLIDKPATNCQGNGISYDFALPIGLTGQNCAITLYGQSAGSYASGDIGVYVYDIANTTIITPSVVNISSGGPAAFTATFLTTTSTAYRLILHLQTTNASAYTLEVDNINVSATLAPVDSIGTVQLAEAAGNISTTFTKTADHKFLRFNYSGAVLGNSTGTIVLSVGGNTVRTITTQGPPVNLGSMTNVDFAATGVTSISGLPRSSGGSSNASLPTITVTGATGASGAATGDEWIDITGEADGSLAYAVTFTNFTQASAAVYRNRVGG